MRGHSDCFELQHLACRALANPTINDNNRLAAVQASAISAIVDNMRKYASHVGIQDVGCGALSNLASHIDQSSASSSPDPASRTSAVLMENVESLQTQVIEVIISAMRDHLAFVTVQAVACSALWALTTSDVMKVKVAEYGLLESIIAAMRQHVDAEDVQAFACLALSHLTSRASTQPAAHQAEIVQALTAAIRQFPDILDLQVQQRCQDAVIQSEVMKSL